MITERLIDEYVDEHKACRWMDAGELRDVLTDFAKDLGWHSVEESLPELNEEVIVMWFEYGEVRAEPIRQIAIASLIQPIQCVPTGEKIWPIPGVKYWMPLPKIKQQ